MCSSERGLDVFPILLDELSSKMGKTFCCRYIECRRKQYRLGLQDTNKKKLMNFSCKFSNHNLLQFQANKKQSSESFINIKYKV